MIEEQKMIDVEISELVDKAREYREAGYRLVQINATRTQQFELNYSFDKEYQFVNLRIQVPTQETVVPSITSVYWNAFLYENEMHDLFGITITGIAIDYQGKFFRIAKKFPFGEKND